MTLALTFAAVAVGLFVLFWAGSLFLQAYLYNEPASKLPARAALGGVLVAAVLTLWVQVNTRAESKDKYGTLFEFNPTAAQPIDGFAAVRQFPGADAEGKPKVAKVAVTKAGTRFVEANDPGKTFALNTADYKVVAVELPDGDATARFEAELDANGNYVGGDLRRFTEAGGRRYIEFGRGGVPSPVYQPSRAAFFAAIGLNLLHFLTWFAAIWLVLRFTAGHAFGLAAIFWLVFMLFVMPLMFDRNRVDFAPPQVATLRDR